MKIPTRIAFSFLFCFIILSRSNFLAKAQNTTISVNVGVILDFDTWTGKMGLSCIKMALADFYASHNHYKTRLHLHSRDSKCDVVEAAAGALDLIKNMEVQAIIGPQNSMQANFMIDLGEKAQVPIVTFSATSPSLTSLRSPYFFRVAQNDSSQVKAISAIVQAFGWREAVPIYVDNSFGEGIIPYLVDALQNVDARVPYRSMISPSATDDQIGEELYKLMTMQTRVFIVHMSTNIGSRLFNKAKEIGMMGEGYIWITTNGITNSLSSLERSVLDSMQGVLGVKTYVPKTKELENFRVRWKSKFQQDNPTILNAELNVLGLWAYDAASALARAVEKVGTTNFYIEQTTASRNLTDLEAIGVSQNGPKLREALLGTRFTGLAGDFSLVNGQLQSSIFKIINMNGNGERGIAFWTPKNGLKRELNSRNTTTSKKNLGPIIWPGDSSSVPKGWEVPTNGKKLRIGVPVTKGFGEFVKVTHDANNNRTQVTGYSIDVFSAVMETLPYAVNYEFIPFANSSGGSAGSYNDLVYQVYLRNFDAVVGDTTITANRSNFVDFTLPYIESEVSLVVPIRDNGSKNAWIFLKPLSWDLWITSGCFFVFTGFIVWVLEHRINEDFRGPPSHQIGTSLWYSFSTLVFAQRERVVSNLTRFVVIIWVFVVLILTQSYTASLTSLLTIQQLQPTVTDINQLIKNGEHVGYQGGSFVLGILKEMKFDENKLIIYDTPEECDQLLSKGSANGGIAGAIIETPMMKLFLGQYCSKYTMVESIYKTDGFGFVFPIGSPLVSDVSRAILNVTEGKKRKEIENAWLGNQNNCTNSNNQVSSASLTLASFWGLFLIAGVASLLSLIISMSMFLYKERQQILIHFYSEGSILRRIHHTLGIFDKKDLKSHTFKNMALQDGTGIDSVQVISASEASPNSEYTPSPSSYSTHTEPPCDCLGAFGTPPREYGDLSPNGQASQLAPVIELISYPNQEGITTIEIAHENC
ncbi:glutamate receptor 2.1-like [Quercus robur]|uniref:glutamate receptor 2.1-like n=1 Tax=Quercus robur TaxID=38942 RepID=UPI002163116E|nr:glutamate receptor 2.1-like [Quercus robur]